MYAKDLVQSQENANGTQTVNGDVIMIVVMISIANFNSRNIYN